jgi:cytochrome c553
VSLDREQSAGHGSTASRTAFLDLLPCLCLSLAIAFSTTFAWCGEPQQPLVEPAAIPLPAQACLSCHGPEGNSGDDTVPSIAGLPRSYLIKTLRGYSQGVRFGTLMDRLAPGYDEAELWVVADYFSRQTRLLHRQRVDWEKVRVGRQLHRLYCQECHGDLEQPAESQTPPLNGQGMDYLRRTLNDCLLGISQIDQEMSERLIRVIRHHGEAGIEALIHYYGSAR